MHACCRRSGPPSATRIGLLAPRPPGPDGGRRGASPPPSAPTGPGKPPRSTPALNFLSRPRAGPGGRDRREPRTACAKERMFLSPRTSGLRQLHRMAELDSSRSSGKRAPQAGRRTTPCCGGWPQEKAFAAPARVLEGCGRSSARYRYHQGRPQHRPGRADGSTLGVGAEFICCKSPGRGARDLMSTHDIFRAREEADRVGTTYHAEQDEGGPLTRWRASDRSIARTFAQLDSPVRDRGRCRDHDACSSSAAARRRIRQDVHRRPEQVPGRRPCQAGPVPPSPQSFANARNNSARSNLAHEVQQA